MGDKMVRARPPEAVLHWAHEMYDQCHQQVMRDLGPDLSRPKACEATVSGCIQSIIAEAVRDTGSMSDDTLFAITQALGTALGITFHRIALPEEARGILIARLTDAVIKAQNRLDAVSPPPSNPPTLKL